MNIKFISFMKVKVLSLHIRSTSSFFATIMSTEHILTCFDSKNSKKLH